MMKFSKLFSLLAVLLVTAVFAFGQKESARFAKGELLVKVPAGSDLRAVDALAAANGAELVESFGDLGWHRFRLADGADVEESAAAFVKSGLVEAAQPNFYYRVALTPNDAQFASLYGLAKISAPAAWDLTTGSSSVVVANIDTGARYTHEDLAANTWTNPGEIQNNGVDDDGNGFVDDFFGYDFRYNDPDPLDEHGHGTHTAGTIGAVGNNLLGVVGVSWNVKIMTIKIYSASGSDSTSAMLINAYNYVRTMRNRGVNVRVTNNSYGDCPEACGYDQATRDALEALGNAGVLNVFAAGNSARNVDTGAPFYPASYNLPTILSVASSTSTDARSGFSNWGAVSVDVAAPGSSILSTTFGSNSTYGNMSGTSMASPHAAGAAALLAAHNPALSNVSLKATLMNTVDQLAGWNGLVKTGGRLNVANALQNQTVCGFTPTQNQISVRFKGGTYTVDVTAPPNCDFSAKSNARWISLVGADTFSGNATVTFRVATGRSVSRTGTITIAGQTVTVVQNK